MSVNSAADVQREIRWTRAVQLVDNRNLRVLQIYCKAWFNRPYSESASLGSTGPQAADAPSWCSLDNLELICFHIWFIHSSLGWQGKAVLAGCVAVSDGSDLGVRLWVRRLLNGPIRSSYHSLPHHDRESSSFLSFHLLEFVLCHIKKWP